MDFDSLVQKKKINISGRSLSDGDIKVVAEVLQKSTVLEDLNLMLNEITLADGTFTHALAENQTLRILSLYNNKIGAEGANRLADALKVNRSLQQLNLEGNQIGDAGARSLAEALESNTSIEVIILRGNSIGDAGASDLATAFLFNKSLRVVLLGENKITNAGAESLAHALEHNAMIDQIMLDSNPMSNVMELKIRNVLTKPSRKNPSSQTSLPKKVVEHLMAEKDKELAKKEAALKAALDELLSKTNEVSLVKQLKEELAAKTRKIERRDAALTSKATDIARRDKKLAQKDEQIDALKKTLNSPLELLVMFIEKKDKEIVSLKAALEKAQAEEDSDESSDDSDDSEDSDESDDEYADHTNENKDPGNILKSNGAILNMHNKNVKSLKNVDIAKDKVPSEINVEARDPIES